MIPIKFLKYLRIWFLTVHSHMILCSANLSGRGKNYTKRKKFFFYKNNFFSRQLRYLAPLRTFAKKHIYQCKKAYLSVQKSIFISAKSIFISAKSIWYLSVQKNIFIGAKKHIYQCKKHIYQCKKAYLSVQQGTLFLGRNTVPSLLWRWFHEFKLGMFCVRILYY